MKEFLVDPFNKIKVTTIDESFEIKSGTTPRDRDEELNSGIVLLKTNDIRNNVLYDKKDDFFYIDPDVNESLKATQLKAHDVLINIVGATTEVIGRVSIVPDDFPSANITQAISLIRKKKSSLISQFYLFAFLLSKYGSFYVRRNARQTSQYNMNHSELGSFPIPILGGKIQILIELLVKQANYSQKKSHDLQNECEESLLKELELNKFIITNNNITTKKYSESFLSSGRLDPEYYQPKYTQYEQAVLRCLLGHTVIQDEFTQIEDGVNLTKSEYKYIEIGDVNIGDGSCNYTVRPTEELPANAKYLVQKGDLLISKVRPNRGAVTIIPFNEPDLIVSGAFTVLRTKPRSAFSNETLKVLLRTNIYKDWLLKFNVGTQYPVIKDEDILNLPIPKISVEKQLEIYTMIKEAELMRHKSESLLEIAKHAVEIAIEQDESVAEKYIADECQKIGATL